jgi:hypothetical protein
MHAVKSERLDQSSQHFNDYVEFDTLDVAAQILPFVKPILFRLMAITCGEFSRLRIARL